MWPVFVSLYCNMLRKRGLYFYLVIGLVAVYIINGLIAIPKNSVTYDEMDHWSYGKRILKLQPEKIYPYDDASAMPVSGLNALPRAIEQVANPKLLKTDGGFSDIMHGRYITLIICLLTGFFIYKWSKDLFGKHAALFSLFLFVFCPNLNGHGILFTTDAYTALFTISTAYFYWKFNKQSGWKYFLLFSLSLALAQLVKYTMLHLFILLAVISVLQLIKRKTIFSNWKINVKRLGILTVIFLFVINTGYFFKNTGISLSAIETRSKTFTNLKSSVIGKISIPLPGPYIEGLDLTMHMNELGAGNPNVSGVNYLLGEKRSGTGFWYYYMVTFFFKTPVSVLFLLLCVILFLFVRKKKEGHPGSILLLLSIVFYFLILLGLQANSQVGLRHVILIYPLLYVLAGTVWNISFFKNKLKYIIPALVLYSVTTFYFYFPNLISYSNEFITDKKNAYKVFADSNLDFGQGWFKLEQYLKNHQEVKMADTVPATGKFALSVNDYLDLNETRKYSWLKRIKPDAHIDHCFLLFTVYSEDLNK